ncbi:MAG: type II secretion system protein, partial [Bacilli bacterium]|nr:type II secretion system protein [Bacilli bacterium]
MNKKGFTLIELLAVIVILSIIAVITVPMIMNVIDKAKLGALEDSAYGLIESANLWYAENVSNAVKDTKFTIEKNKQTSDNTDITKLLSYKGTIDKGYVSILSTGKVAVCID